MAKKTKTLMIPFTYHYENMIDYCGYTYVEGTTNSSAIWWDTENDKQVSIPWKPSEPSKTYWCSDEQHQRDLENYPKIVKEYEEKLKTFNEKVEEGIYKQVDSITWKENFEFEDELYVSGMSRGRSAANFSLVSETTGKSYNFFMTDMVNMLQNGIINKGKIKGTWTFVKRGQNYGTKLVY